MPNYDNLPTSALVGLARLILKRAKLESIPVQTREQAIKVIRGVRPAPPRKSKINVKPIYALCFVCHKPLAAGALCDSLGKVHISCQ
jgi:hypothetical protein